MEAETMTAPKPATKAKRPPIPKAAPLQLDTEAIRGALAQIADHGRNNTALLVALLEQSRGLNLKRKGNTTTAQMLGVHAQVTGGDLAALELWANAARRALLRA
jgi:hypothetical protein